MPLKYITDIQGAASDNKKQLIFIESVNQHIQSINKLITDFSQLPPDAPEKKLTILNEIYNIRQRMNNHYHTSHITASLEYQVKIHKNLFEELSQEFKLLGISLNHRILSPPSPHSPSGPEIVANMPHDKLRQLISVCWLNPIRLPQELLSFYDTNNPDEAILYKELHSFLTTHAMAVLNSEGNSRNILINSPTQNMVLKIDPRRGQPKSAEISLREKGYTHLVKSVGEERQATVLIHDTRLTATVVFTEFCPGGDLLSWQMTHKSASSLTEIIQQAVNYYEQMINALLEMQSYGVAFTDAKNENWLIDEHHRLKISDTKSFISISGTDLIDIHSEKNQWNNLTWSSHLIPQDLLHAKHAPFSADKMHAYMVGKNLYQFLTNCSIEFLLDYIKNDHPYFLKFLEKGPKNSFEERDFHLPVFNSQAGQCLKTLIQQLVQPDSFVRISLQQALKAIQSLKTWLSEPSQRLIKESLEIIKKIKMHSHEDDILENYLLQTEKKLARSSSHKDLLIIQQELIEHAIEIEAVNSLPHFAQLVFKKTAIPQRLGFFKHVIAQKDIVQSAKTEKEKLDENRDGNHSGPEVT